jgi:hypothetical protein
MKKQINEIKRMQLIAGLITESEYQESLMNEMSEEEVLNILNQNGVDDDYFESMGGKEIESGTEEWMGILTDLTGKDAFEADFDDVDNQKIMSFIKKLKEMGIELV